MTITAINYPLLRSALSLAMLALCFTVLQCTAESSSHNTEGDSVRNNVAGVPSGSLPSGNSGTSSIIGHSIHAYYCKVHGGCDPKDGNFGSGTSGGGSGSSTSGSGSGAGTSGGGSGSGTATGTTSVGSKMNYTVTLKMAVDVEPTQNLNQTSAAEIIPSINPSKSAQQRNSLEKKNDGSSSSTSLVLAFAALVPIAVMAVAPL